MGLGVAFRTLGTCMRSTFHFSIGHISDESRSDSLLFNWTVTRVDECPGNIIERKSGSCVAILKSDNLVLVRGVP